MDLNHDEHQQNANRWQNIFHTSTTEGGDGTNEVATNANEEDLMVLASQLGDVQLMGNLVALNPEAADAAAGEADYSHLRKG